MPKRTVEMDDSLDEDVEQSKEELREKIVEYLDDNEPISQPDTGDFCEDIQEIADSNTPIYTKNIDDIWYFNAPALEEAYENAGIGNDSRENHGMTAIYCYIEQEMHEFLRREYDDMWEQWDAWRDAKTELESRDMTLEYVAKSAEGDAPAIREWRVTRDADAEVLKVYPQFSDDLPDREQLAEQIQNWLKSLTDETEETDDDE